MAGGHEVVVVEKDPDVADRVRPTVPGAGWVVGDACEMGTLQEAGLETAEVVVAATGDDEDNLVGSLVRLLTFEGSSVRLVEVTLAEGSPAAERSISDLDLPRDATIVAVMRAGHVIVPRGDTVLGTNDEILALVTPQSEDEVKGLLVGGQQPASPSA